MASFTQRYFTDAGSDNAILLEPVGDKSGAEDIHCLGLRILQGRPSWRGFKTLGDRTALDGLVEWRDDVIRRFEGLLHLSGILGGIIAFGGRLRYITDDERYSGPPIKDDGYLAAFLALWLCKFIMPSGERNTIRPEVFVMASKLGKGTKIALAPAILCAIQVALCQMSSDPQGPSHSSCRFPIHFWAAWVHSHFRGTCIREKIDQVILKTLKHTRVPEMLRFKDAKITSYNSRKPQHDARRSRVNLWQQEKFVWRPFPFALSREGWVHEIIDLSRMTEFPDNVKEYLMSIRHSVIPLRMGNIFHAQSYNPHRFARQFGFDQHYVRDTDNIAGIAASAGVLMGEDFRRLESQDLKRPRVDASMATTSVTKASQIHTKWFPEEKLPSPTPSRDNLNENTYSPMIGNEVEPLPVLASFDEGHDRNLLIDAKIIVADPQDIASHEIEDSIPSRYNPEVDYEPTPSISKANSGSLQDTVIFIRPAYEDHSLVVNEDVSDTNTVVSERTLIVDESKDNVDDTATTRSLEIKPANGDDPVAAVGVSSENMLLKEGGGAGHPISTDHGVGQGSRPTLIDHLIEAVRTSSYHTYPDIQEKVTEYCEILSRIGVDTSGLSMRLHKLFKEAEAIREVAAHPSYSSSARILKAKEHMDRITKELKDYDSKRSSLTRTKEKALTLLDQQRQKVEDLERTLATARAKEAELNDEVNTINECIFRLDSGKDKAVAMTEGAIEEFGATEGSHSMTVEFNHLSNLIRDFEHHCKEFDL
uniref:Aminotransferase-like plant mobile domain-containing protein n=1 Tax=Ananas comosus var. bracteatus TaxID=296719 RepID=A0A6V7NIC4_ANACO|nr:unnamed protein product [Ananas comosus var. bracteatus]